MKRTIEFYWRPGCPFCGVLRWRLRRLGLPITEINIWEDPRAAARVRSITGGDETVPTVVVGSRSMVNPRGEQVLTAVRAEAPELLPPALAAERSGSATLMLSLILAALWTGLAAWHPTVTYHLAPGLVAAAAPVTWRMGRRGALPGNSALMAGAFGLAVAGTTTAILGITGHLAGPTVTGSGDAVLESLLVALLGTVLGTWYARRR